MADPTTVAMWLDVIGWIVLLLIVVVSCTFVYAIYYEWRDVGDAYFRAKNHNGQLWYLGDMDQEIYEHENGLEVFHELRDMIRRGQGPVTEEQYNLIMQRFDDVVAQHFNQRTAH